MSFLFLPLQCHWFFHSPLVGPFQCVLASNATPSGPQPSSTAPHCGHRHPLLHRPNCVHRPQLSPPRCFMAGGRRGGSSMRPKDSRRSGAPPVARQLEMPSGVYTHPTEHMQILLKKMRIGKIQFIGAPLGASNSVHRVFLGAPLGPC